MAILSASKYKIVTSAFENTRLSFDKTFQSIFGWLSEPILPWVWYCELGFGLLWSFRFSLRILD